MRDAAFQKQMSPEEQDVQNETVPSPATNDGARALEALADIADAMNLPLSESVTVAQMRDHILKLVQTTPSETPQKPVAWAIRAKRDGSISEEVAPVGWTSFDKRMEQMKQHSWVVNDVAEIVPLYLGAASVPSATPRNPWTFELDAAQVEKMEAWRKEQDAVVLERQRADGAGDPFIAAVHEGGSPYYGAIGGELSFSFSPNSIGEVAKVKHSGTGAELDLTDYDAW